MCSDDEAFVRHSATTPLLGNSNFKFCCVRLSEEIIQRECSKFKRFSNKAKYHKMFSKIRRWKTRSVFRSNRNHILSSRCGSCQLCFLSVSRTLNWKQIKSTTRLGEFMRYTQLYLAVFPRIFVQFRWIKISIKWLRINSVAGPDVFCPPSYEMSAVLFNWNKKKKNW